MVTRLRGFSLAEILNHVGNKENKTFNAEHLVVFIFICTPVESVTLVKKKRLKNYINQ